MIAAEPQPNQGGQAKMRVAIPLVLVTLVAVGPATSATSWNSNSFRSPSGNIACRFQPRGSAANTYASINCYTENDTYLMSVQTEGRKASGGYVGYDYTRGRAVPAPARTNMGMLKALHVWVPAKAPVLRYGWVWTNNASTLRCESLRSGMRCHITFGRHGFFLSRYRYQAW
jgi:hypothetical protein